jgi:hypothetical protein
MVDDLLERLNDWHIDILKHDIDWGRMVVDAIEVIEELQNKCKHLESEVARLERLSNG